MALLPSTGSALCSRHHANACIPFSFEAYQLRRLYFESTTSEPLPNVTCQSKSPTVTRRT